ncbi:MAG: ATP-dependent DNA helicase [Chromatiales bacterium]|jgi:ATP-dependent DNA helicase DinG
MALQQTATALDADIAEYLGPDGLLAQQVEGFSYRPQQAEMAEAVADVINAGGALICEAGTGTGKTFAYLLPVLLSGKKAIISTGTKNLQDQLFHRDLPSIRELLDTPVKVALLKGRANYLCTHRMDNALVDTRGHSKDNSEHLAQIRQWSTQTRRGDIAELAAIPEDASVWPLVTSTADNCLGQECPGYQSCFLVEARRAAQEADVVVINHHLLCADFALRDDGFGELLPACDCFVIDEAHQLPEVASNFFGTAVSGRQLLDLSRDIDTEYHRDIGDLPKILTQSGKLSKAVRDLRLLFGAEPRRGGWQEVAADERLQRGIAEIRRQLDDLKSLLNSIRGRSKGIDSCLERCDKLAVQLLQICENQQQDNDIRWYETFRQSFRFNLTPLEINDVFAARMLAHPASWVFTSATLSVNGNFSHFQQQLGVSDAITRQWDSPFDYQQQALWFVPRGLPEPNARDYNKEVARLSIEILEASQGRAFLLYTSYRAMHEAAEILEEEIDFPLLIQGTAPKNELLQRFRELGNAVLMGTASFWEGVDVRGEALSCVIIDKLPFASPGDPVLQARIDALRKKGGNPFMEFQVPQAAIALKQGAGRLIRDVDDRGVLVVCDPRLLSRSKPYGKIFLNSMPDFARTRDLEDVQRFFAS